MNITPGDPGYDQLVELIGQSLLEAVPKGTPADLAINAMLNAAQNVIAMSVPAGPDVAERQPQEEFQLRAMARAVVFMVHSAAEMGVDLDRLTLYCRELAHDDNERTFFNARQPH